MVLKHRKYEACSAGQKLAAMLLFAFCSVLLLSGCVSTGKRQTVFAFINGEPINESDLVYSLNIAHRREDLSSTKSIDIHEYLQKLIDERLIMQEARRMDIERLPDVQQAINAYILRESVTRLHAEEIVQRVSVTEEEIKNEYRKNYEKFTLGLIELNSEEEAKKARQELKDGGDFKEVARKYSEHSSKKDSGEITAARVSMAPNVQDAVLKLKPNELTDVISLNSKFYILKFISRNEAPDEDFEKAKESIGKTLRKAREKERSTAYLKALREQAAVKVNRDILATIRPDIGNEEKEKMLKDKTPLAEVNGSVLTVGEFVPMIMQQKQMPEFEKGKEDAVNGWIDYKLVDYEALRRHYELKDDLKDMLENYKDQLLKNAFFKKVITPRIDITETMLKDYYTSHRSEYLKPNRYRVQQITVKTREEADDILKALKGGDDFAWMAKRKSVDLAKESGGDIGWVVKGELPEHVANIVDALKPGEVSQAVSVNGQYRIIRLQGKTADEVEEFDKVKGLVSRSCFATKFKEIYDSYVEQLKKDADIRINSDAVREFEQRFKK